MVGKRSIRSTLRRTFPGAIFVLIVMVITLIPFTMRAHYSLLRVRVLFSNIRNSNLSESFVSKPYPRINILQYSGYRTGSSYISQFFNQHLGVFYAFEPEQVPNSKREILMPKILEALYNCNLNRSGPLGSIDPTWLSKDVFCHLSPPTGGCTSAQKRCKHSDIRVVKLIALPKLSLTESLLRRGVRVVHTVRDPRGTIDSLHGIGECKGMERMVNCSRDYCQRILSDLDFIHRLRDIYGDQILQLYLLVRYEDFAIEAVHNMEKLYQFLGVKPDNHTLKWARRNTAKSIVSGAGSHKRSTSQAYTTYRSNPAATSQAWRTRINWETVKFIQQNDACRKVLDLLHYRIYNDNTALLNINNTSSTEFDMSNIFEAIGA